LTTYNETIKREWADKEADAAFAQTVEQDLLTEYQQQRERALAAELARRDIDALRLYSPMPLQEEFHKCRAREIGFEGGVRSGKTLACAVEIARAVRNEDPHGKYRKTAGFVGIVGFKEDHISLTVYPTLFKAGAFDIIRDATTNKWRTFDPVTDADRFDEKKPAPPLIPPRFIKETVWEKKAQGVFKIVRLKNGWEIHAFSSKALPAKGFSADIFWFDEDIENEQWFYEATSRIMQRCGRIFWSAMPEDQNDAMMLLCDRAEEDEGKDNPDSVVFRASVADNRYIPADAARFSMRVWHSKGEDEYVKRALGQRSATRLMYPGFATFIHRACKPLTNDELRAEADGVPLRTKIQKFLTEREGEPGEDWCRYAFFDPGHTVAAVIMLASPPPHWGDYVVAYDEIHLRGAIASTLADLFAPKAKSYTFQAFFMDMHGGKLADLATGVQPASVYSDELRSRGARSVDTGWYFLPGSDNKQGRQMRLREWLAIRPDGTPKLLVVEHRCQMLCQEMKRCRKKRAADGSILDEREGRRGDTVDCLEMAAAHGCAYVKPRISITRPETLSARRKRRQREREERHRALSLLHGDDHIDLNATGARA